MKREGWKGLIYLDLPDMQKTSGANSGMPPSRQAVDGSILLSGFACAKSKSLPNQI